MFVNWGYSMFLYQLIQRTVLDAIRFLLSSLIANMETILENFQQKFSSVREKFLTFVIKFRTKQISRARKVCFKIVVKLVRKMWRFNTWVISRSRSKQLSDRK